VLLVISSPRTFSASSIHFSTSLIIAAFFIVFTVAKEPEIAPVIGVSNKITFSLATQAETIEYESFKDELQNALTSEVNHVILFIDYNMNTYDFEEFTKYNGYKTLRSKVFDTNNNHFEGEKTLVNFTQVINTLTSEETNINERKVYLYDK